MKWSAPMKKYDPFGSITQLRLQAEYNFCRIEEGLQQGLYKSGELEHAVQRKSCLREKIEGLTIIEGKITALKEKFRNNKKEYAVAAKPLFQSYTQLLQKNRCN